MNHSRFRFLVVIAVLALTAGACGGGDDTADTQAPAPAPTNAPAPAPTSPPAPDTTTPKAPDTTASAPSGGVTELTIGALDNEGFTRDKLTAPVGDITVTFKNDDLSTGEPHNWHLVTDFGEWATLIKEAPDTQSVSFTIPAVGEYEFFCDTHLETMKGTLIVTP